MQQTIEKTVANEAQSKIIAMGNTPVSAKIATSFRLQIDSLSTEASAWEVGVYANSNTILYSLIQKSYELYKDLTNDDDGNLKYRKQGLADYLALKGLSAYTDKPMAARIIRCVFGNKDRRRISTYTTVLKFIIKQGYAVADVPAKITELGGVQEISLGRAGNALTPQQKAQIAKEKVSDATLGSVRSEALSNLASAETMGDKFAAVVTQEADGSFSINCIVKSKSAVNATLAAYFGANKDSMAVEAEEKKLSNAQNNADQLTQQAIAA